MGVHGPQTLHCSECAACHTAVRKTSTQNLTDISNEVGKIGSKLAEWEEVTLRGERSEKQKNQSNKVGSLKRSTKLTSHYLD